MTPEARLDITLPTTGSRQHRREAVRALVSDPAGRLLLLTESRGTGLKFPGGGVEAGEDDAEALARELTEETGYVVGAPVSLAVVVSETRPGIEPDVVLVMESRYYRVGVAARGATALQDDEVALGLEVVWLPLAEALARQRAHVASGRTQPWSRRELAVLEWLASTSPGGLATG